MANGLTRIEQDSMNAVISMNRKMKDQREIDWEQRRYEIAKACMANVLISQYTPHDAEVKLLVQDAVLCADALINELKKGGEK